MSARSNNPATLMDRRTGAAVMPDAELEGHYGGTEWRFERIHSFPDLDAARFVGGFVSVRNIASGSKATISVESFPHLYWTEETTELAKPDPEETAAIERVALSDLVASLTGDRTVTIAEAADVVAWCREWGADVQLDSFGEHDVSDIASPALAPTLLRLCNRFIDGGLAFVLADVRRDARGSWTPIVRESEQYDRRRFT